MIRSIWLIVATMSIANLMILLIGAGWLYTTDRVDLDRLNQTRQLYQPTIAQARADADAEAQRAQNLIDDLVALGFEDSIPLDAESAARLLEQFDYTQRERFAREEANIEVLRAALTADIRRLAKEREAFDTERSTFERRRTEIEEREGSEQFQKAVKLYALTKPDVAKGMLQALIDQGDQDQAVAYLNALKPDVTAKIIERFQTDDPTLAADLLERIRAYGVEATTAGVTPDD